MSNSGVAPILYCSKCGSAMTATAQFCNNCGTPVPAASTLPYPVAYSRPYAGFWIRFVAFIIDAIIVGVICSPFVMMMVPSMMAGILRSGNRGPDPETMVALMVTGFKIKVITQVIAWIYEAWMTSSDRQATVGKIAVGLKVTDLNGQRISFARATGRHFAKILSAVIFMIGFIMAAFTERKQGLHDILAGTLVVKG
jgi:uncharacterized RDD family membrane protein YckC